MIFFLIILLVFIEESFAQDSAVSEHEIFVIDFIYFFNSPTNSNSLGWSDYFNFNKLNVLIYLHEFTLIKSKFLRLLTSLELFLLHP